jgi:hypothetical protein
LVERKLPKPKVTGVLWLYKAKCVTLPLIEPLIVVFRVSRNPRFEASYLALQAGFWGFLIGSQ